MLEERGISKEKKKRKVSFISFSHAFVYILVLLFHVSSFLYKYIRGERRERGEKEGKEGKKEGEEGFLLFIFQLLPFYKIYIREGGKREEEVRRGVEEEREKEKGERKKGD